MKTMSAQRHALKTLIVSPLIVSLLGLSACNRNGTPSDTSAASAPQAASAPAAYTPPTADQLYQMVAPIALFPDKLVALVLAGSTYPDQITAANNWVTQNPSLTGQALANAADAQPWDPSVKALTKFPAVLAQMASNTAWTTSLGQAYYNDPTDVMNAIQVMRQRAQASGNLHSSRQMRVTRVAQAAPADYRPANDVPVIYAGPDIVPPPEQAIEIEPAEPDEVYVPSYNPAVVYGEPVSTYPGYVPPPVYAADDGAPAAGLITFGVAVAVGAVIIGHHDWGWHSWGMNWGGPHHHEGDHDGDHRDDYRQRPAVVYNNTTYVTRSNTVINNITNVRNTEITNNYGHNVTNNTTYVRNVPPQGPGPVRAPDMQNPGAAPMSVPHFGANDMRPGSRPPPEAFAQNHGGAPGQQPPGAMHEDERQRMMQQHNEAQQQQQRQEMQQRNEAQQQQQRQEMQQRNEAQQQQQRQEMQQRNEAQQQQQRQEMQQREAQQQQQRQEMQQREAQQQQQMQQQRQEMQQRAEAQRQQQQQQPAHAPRDPRDQHPQ